MFALNPEAFVSMLLCQVMTARLEPECLSICRFVSHQLPTLLYCNIMPLLQAMRNNEAIAMFGVRTFAVGQVPALLTAHLLTAHT